jgi:hypothetical protein
VVLTELLQKARQPLTGRELAEQVAATGYQTSSKSLKDNVWAMLAVMDNVEHLPGKGLPTQEGLTRQICRHSLTP